MSESQTVSPVIDEHQAVADRVFRNMRTLLKKDLSAAVRADSVTELKEKSTVGCLQHIEALQKKTMRAHNLTPAE